MSKTSIALQPRIDLSKNRAVASVERIEELFKTFPWDDRQAYGNWLAQIYHYVRHATRLLAFAAAKCNLDKEGLHKSLLKSIREEAGHEELAAKDVAALGYTLDSFPELAETLAYRQTLYYAIDHSGPAALIGYFLPLEGLAARQLSTELQHVTKLYGTKAVNFLRVHCHLDVSHFDEGLKMLEGLTAAELDVVDQTLDISSEIYCQMVGRTAKSLAEVNISRKTA